MLLKEKVVKTIENAYSYINLCLEEVDKIEEMFGVPEDAKLMKMREDALGRKKDQIVMILGIIAPFADEINTYPQFIEPFKHAEKLLLGKNFKFTGKPNPKQYE